MTGSMLLASIRARSSSSSRQARTRSVSHPCMAVTELELTMTVAPPGAISGRRSVASATAPK